jgi:hypothetical protein
MGESEYRALPLLNHSNLKNFIRSPWHYKNPKEIEPTEPMKQGSALHCLFLEGQTEFNKKFIVMPDVDGRTTEGKAIKKRFEEECQGKTVIKHDTHQNVLNMYQALINHPALSDLIGDWAMAQRECVMLGEIAGVKCKAKVDIFHDGRIWDVKTTSDASMNHMKREIADRCYHTQGGFYTTLANAVTGSVLPTEFSIIAVESAQPFGINVIHFDQDLIAKCQKIVENRVIELKFCEEHNQFPDYGENTLGSLYGIN